MARYIREEEVYNLFGQNGMARLHVGDIDVLPRTEIKETKGEWKEDTRRSWVNGRYYVTGFLCSECGSHSDHRYLYCHGCGACMHTTIKAESKVEVED